MNWQAVKAIYFFEMARFFRTLTQSFVSPVISTSPPQCSRARPTA